MRSGCINAVDTYEISPSTEQILHDVLFGSLPDKIVKEPGCRVLILKQPEQRTESWIEMIHDKIKKYVLLAKTFEMRKKVVDGAEKTSICWNSILHEP